jgi:DNA-binding MarR family transcriptional regulator
MSDSSSTEILIEKFWETIPPVWHRTRTVIRGTAAEKFHLTVEQFQVLRRVRRGIASVSAIADDNRTSRSAVSKAVDALVNKGLIARSQDPNDRRNIPLTLTAEGQRALSAIFAEAETWLAVQFEQLTPEERRTFLAGLDLLQKVFAKD